MVKNWSKTVLVSLLVIAIAAPVFATTARVRSLANTGDYLSDDSNVFRWYSTLPSYANMVQAEIGTWNSGWVDGYDGGLFDSRALGFNYACGEDGKWGTYRLSLLENAVDDPGYYLVSPFVILNALSNGAEDAENPFNTTPVNKWDLAGGWEIGENSVLGVSFTRSSFKIEDQQNDPAQDQSVSWTTIGAGYTFTNNEDFILDATFTYATAGGDETLTPNPNATPDPSQWEWDKSTGIDIAGRLFYDWKDYVTLIPVVDYMQSEYLLKSNATTQPTGDQGNKTKAFMVGIGMDLEVNGSNTLVFAAEYNWAKFQPSQPDTNESTISILPTFRLALESEITSWLTTRVGALHRNITNTSTVANRDLKWTNGSPVADPPFDSLSGFGWFLGAGFNVAEWTIDMELAPETPFSLGWWLHGYSAFDSGTEYGPIARISGTYNF